jgi:SsrA-binding protein
MAKSAKHTPDGSGIKVIARNKKARHDYEILETIEAGIVLIGSEVKSVRDGKASLTDAYAVIENGEAFMVNAHIAEYPFAHQFNHEPKRRRKLLLHAREIHRLGTKIRERGYTLTVLTLYFKQGKVKVELALARGRRHYDKREVLKQKDAERLQESSFKRR